MRDLTFTAHSATTNKAISKAKVMIILKKEKTSAELYCTNTDQQNEEEIED